jgi:hypothetical protein
MARFHVLGQRIPAKALFRQPLLAFALKPRRGHAHPHLEIDERAAALADRTGYLHAPQTYHPHARRSIAQAEK